MQEDDKFVLALSLSAVLILIVSILAGALSIHKTHRSEPTVLPSFTPEPVPTIGPLDGFLGFPNFLRTQNTLQVTGEATATFGGSWIESRGVGVVYSGTTAGLSMNAVSLDQEGTTMLLSGGTQLTNRTQTPYATMSRYADVDLIAAIHSMNKSGCGDVVQATTYYRDVTSSYEFGQNIVTTIGAATETIAEFASPDNTPTLMVVGESTNVKPYIFCYKLDNRGEVDTSYQLTYGDTGALYNVFGLDGNENVCALAVEKATAQGEYTVYTYTTDGKGTFSDEKNTLLSIASAAPFDASDRQVNNCVGVGDKVIAVVTATQLQIFTADSSGQYDSARRQSISLSTWDMLDVYNVQVEGELVVIHDQTKAVMLMPLENPSSPTSSYSVTNAQVLALPSGAYGRLPVSYNRHRGVGELLLPDATTGVWTKFAWVLGSKQ